MKIYKKLIPKNWLSKILFKHLKFEIKVDVENEPIQIKQLEKAIKQIKKENGLKPDYLLFKNNSVYIIDSTSYRIEVPESDTGYSWFGG